MCLELWHWDGGGATGHWGFQGNHSNPWNKHCQLQSSESSHSHWPHYPLNIQSYSGHGNAVNELKVHPSDPRLLLSASKGGSVLSWHAMRWVCTELACHEVGLYWAGMPWGLPYCSLVTLVAKYMRKTHLKTTVSIHLVHIMFTQAIFTRLYNYSKGV